MTQPHIIKLKKSRNGDYWTFDGKRWKGLARVNGKIYRYHSDGTKTLLTKPAPSREDAYKGIWDAENMTKPEKNIESYCSTPEMEMNMMLAQELIQKVLKQEMLSKEHQQEKQKQLD